MMPDVTPEQRKMALEETFFRAVENQIDEKGIYPCPGMANLPDGKLEFAMIDDPRMAFDWFWTKIREGEATEVIFGLDRYTKFDQGTEFRDVLTVCHWRKEVFDKAWRNHFRIGVINYQFEPRIVRPIDWDNLFWTRRMFNELAESRPRDYGFAEDLTQ